MPLLIVIAASLLLNGCTPENTQAQVVQTTQMQSTVSSTTVTTTPDTTEETSTEVKHCKQYDQAVKYIDEYKRIMRDQYGEQYLDSSESKAFIESFWKSFWAAHKDCKICPEVNK